MDSENKVLLQVESGNLTLHTVKETKKGYKKVEFKDFSLFYGDKAKNKLEKEVNEELRSNNYVCIIPINGPFITITLEEFNEL